MGFRSFLLDDRRQLLPGGIEVFVNYSVMELPGVLHFAAGVVQAAADDRVRVLAARAHAPLELLDGRRQDEDADASGVDAAYLPRSLPVDLEDQVLAARERLGDDLLRGAVAIAVHLGALEEFAALLHAEEGGLVDEVVVDAVLFAGTRSARGVRDGELQAWIGAHQRVDQRGLARPRRRRNYE
jgi:hypothetical protein